MARTSRRMQALAFLLLLAPLAVHAQLSSVPNLASATKTQASTTGDTTSQSTKAQNNAKSTTQGLTNAPQITSASSSDGLATAGTLTQSAFHRSGIPTIAGAGIPTMVIPYTANAPFMKKSNLPEGTFFIAVGATLAFLGACVLLWRGLVAWSINRGVKRSAMASMQHSEKPRTTSYWGGSTNHGYNRVSTAGRGSFYKDLGGHSNVSLDNLTSAGKVTKPHFRDSVVERNNTSSSNAPPTNLFFSPTAQATQQRDSPYRNSSGYMPSGYYASPNSQAAGGNTATTIGGLNPGHNIQRASAALSAHSAPSPPASPGLPLQSRGSRNTPSRDGLRAPSSRDGLGSARNSTYLYTQPSSSSLMVGGASGSDLAGSRAPSAYLEDLFENHGNGPRERF